MDNETIARRNFLQDYAETLIRFNAISKLVEENSGNFTSSDITSRMTEQFEDDRDYAAIIRGAEFRGLIFLGPDKKYSTNRWKTKIPF
jgi:hypothetical protein|tara:strand:- start:897 stop:1160 length:264 start_codon:yes stop_codon:yes gene_type:complete